MSDMVKVLEDWEGKTKSKTSMTMGDVAEFIIRHSAGRRGGNAIRRLIGNIGPSEPLIRCKSKHGLTFALDPSSVMDAEMMKCGYYEPEVLESLLAHLPPEGVFWDVGANFGVHSITVKALQPNTRVISFEPVPSTAWRFIQNAELNGVTPELIPVALGNQAGYFSMSVKLRGNSGISSLRPWPGSIYDKQMMVRAETGDSMIAAGTVPPPNVLKIDVEGYEYEVFLGVVSHLGNPNLKAIVFESAPESLGRVQNLLESSGFVVAPIAVGGQEGAARNFVALRQR
jgi:FkbM family methyltransferase